MSSKPRASQRTGPGREEIPDLVAQFGAHLLAATTPLAAESLAATVLTLPYRERDGAELGEAFAQTLIDRAGQEPSAEAAALLRGIAAVAPAHQRRRAVAALGAVTAAGHYPPEWAAQIGRAVPGQAWRRQDVFGDTETIAVSFGYGEAEHAVLVQVDRCREPTVLAAMVVEDVAQLRTVLAADDDPLARVEPIELAAARAGLEPALARDHPQEYADLGEAMLASLLLARTRLRRLPVDAAATPPAFGPAERTAVVEEFLASPYAAGAGAEKVARFWAEVLAGYSAYLPGDPPDRVGPLKLSQVLLSYVPNTFALTEEQRHGVAAAVTAWSDWAAQRRGLDEAARTDLAERRDRVLATFEEAYDDPENSRMRGYLADLSATTTDAAVLSDAVNRRALAVPLPDERDPAARGLDAADPAGRRAVLQQEYGGCTPPEGMTGPEFLAAVTRVCEQLWQDDPPELWREAQRLAAAGASNHDVIHHLATGP